mgnify:CR=1 FL=1
MSRLATKGTLPAPQREPAQCCEALAPQGDDRDAGRDLGRGDESTPSRGILVPPWEAPWE